MKKVNDIEKQEIAEFIHDYILENFEEQGQIETLQMEEAFQFRKHPYVINVDGQMECKDTDFGQDEIPSYKVTCWLKSVEIHSTQLQETEVLDADEIAELINAIGGI